MPLFHPVVPVSLEYESLLFALVNECDSNILFMKFICFLLNGFPPFCQVSLSLPPLSNLQHFPLCFFPQVLHAVLSASATFGVPSLLRLVPLVPYTLSASSLSLFALTASALMSGSYVISLSIVSIPVIA